MEQLHAEKKWEAKQERLSQLLDAALRKPERAEEQVECIHQHKETAMPKSFDELPRYSGPDVPLIEQETVTTLQVSSWLSSEQLPALTSLITPHSKESVTMSELNSVSSIMDVTTFQPFLVTILGLSSLHSVTTSQIQHRTFVQPQSMAITHYSQHQLNYSKRAADVDKAVVLFSDRIIYIS